MFRHPMLALALTAAMVLPALAQDSSKHNDSFDVRSSLGDLHLGSDANARSLGLPVYPGARLKTDDEDRNQANLSLFTESFGFKLVVANYDSDDAPARIVNFYRDKLKKYGKVLECHSHKHGGDVDVHDDEDKDDKKDSNANKELTCDENSGPVTELKVGTEDDQHVVAVEPHDSGKGSTFALVYVRTRGKRGEI
ncbi:MAG TPA: hypothetical protein VMD99_11655 [Terriglobales bacterium]|nr:hypothetical protein [Terriglobales bacterium]